MGVTRSRPKKWLIALIASLGTCIGGVVFIGCFSGFGPYDLPTQSRKLEATLERSKELGLPMTQEELVGKPPSDDQNAAPIVVEAMSELKLRLQNYGQALYGTDPVAVRELSDCIKENKDALDRIVLALETRPKWFVKRDYDLGPYLMFEDLAQTKGLVKLLAARAVTRARASDASGALGDIESARKMAQAVSSDFLLVGLLVAIACDNIVLQTIEFVCDAWAGDAAKLKKLLASLRDTSKKLDPLRSLKGEFYMSLATARNFKAFGGLKGLGSLGSGEGQPKFDATKLKRSGLPSGLFARASMATLAEVWNDQFERLKQSEPPYRGWGEQLDAKAQEMEADMSLSKALPLILLPVFRQADHALSASDARMDLTEAFVTCMLYRAEHKAWPKTLAAIRADFDDPLAPGEKIKAKFSPASIRIWSVGRNGVDDSGEPKSTTHPEADDIVYFWPANLRPLPK